MSPLQRGLIEKTGHDNGFEHVLLSDTNGVTLASARHPNRAVVWLESGAFQTTFETGSELLRPELQRSFATSGVEADRFSSADEAGLAALLRRAASLSRALPSQAVRTYQQAVAAELGALPVGIFNTEVERFVRQRVGQNKFRDAMLDYWGGACAVTGVVIPEVLRASHAKPWSECATDAERLDVFNGFLLNASLDALFDRFLVSFDETGKLLIAPHLAQRDLAVMGIAQGMHLRWIDARHQPFLALHRARLR